MIDHLEDNLLHGGEVKILHCQLCTVLNIDTKMNLLLVIVLHAKDKTKIQSILVAVLLENMDQIIENGVVEELDVLDHKDDHLRASNRTGFHELFDAKECLFLESHVELRPILSLVIRLIIEVSVPRAADSLPTTSIVLNQHCFFNLFSLCRKELAI